MSELLIDSQEVKLYPGVIDDTINRALGMEALFAANFSEIEGEN